MDARFTAYNSAMPNSYNKLSPRTGDCRDIKCKLLAECNRVYKGSHPPCSDIAEALKPSQKKKKEITQSTPFKIGKFRIWLSNFKDKVAIYNDSDESGDFSIIEFEKVVQKFFNDNF